MKRVLLALIAGIMVIGAVALSSGQKPTATNNGAELQVQIEERNPWTNLRVNGAQISFFSPDGATLATVTVTGDVLLWDFPARTPWLTILGSALSAAGFAYLVPFLRFRRREKRPRDMAVLTAPPTQGGRG